MKMKKVILQKVKIVIRAQMKKKLLVLEKEFKKNQMKKKREEGKNRPRKMNFQIIIQIFESDDLTKIKKIK